MAEIEIRKIDEGDLENGFTETLDFLSDTNKLDKNNIKEITSVEEINKHRRNFEKSFSHELSNENAYTLCKRHHERLHNIFGQRYTKDLTPKVKNWINIQREKMENEL